MSKSSDGLQYVCKDCHGRRDLSQHKKDWLGRNPGYNRRYKLAKKYGLTPEDVDRLIEEQDGRCPICLRKMPLVVDHDHASGAYRGMLCTFCNVLLGHFDDDPAAFQRAIDYLKRPAPPIPTPIELGIVEAAST